MGDEPEKPNKLYKYLRVGSKGLRGLLERNEIYFSRPEELNDPFECKPFVSVPSKPKDIKAHARHLAQKHAEGRSIAEKRVLTRRAASRIASTDERAKTQYSIAEQSSFYCLSSVPDNLLMWAHYANEHRGCCIEFDVENLNNGWVFRAEPVQYMTDRPVIDIKWYGDRDKYNEIADRTFLSKSIDWEHEREFRIIKYDAAGIETIKAECVTGVIFGCRMNESDRDSLMSSRPACDKFFVMR